MTALDKLVRDARTCSLKERLARISSTRSSYLLVSLAIFAFLSIFVFFNLNKSYALVSTMKNRASRGFSRSGHQKVRRDASSLRPHQNLPISSVDSIFKPVSFRKKSWRSSPNVSSNNVLSTTASRDSPPSDAPTFVITCGSGISDAVDEMKPLLKSILMLISKPVHIVFLTDARGAKRINTLFRHLAWTKKQLWVDVYVMNELLVDKWAAKLRLSVWAHNSGRWGTAKLMIPWIVRDRERAISIDTDMIFMQDPMNLWELFRGGNQDWIYQLPVAHMWGPVGICSCIVLLKLHKIRQYQVYPTKMNSVLSKAKSWYDPVKNVFAPNCGDQGVLWLLMRRFPKLFKRLPVHWARGHCGKYQGALKMRSNLPVGILHRNCAGTNSSALRDEASPFFDFYFHYRMHWLRPSHGVKFPIRVRNFEVRPSIIGL